MHRGTVVLPLNLLRSPYFSVRITGCRFSYCHGGNPIKNPRNCFQKFLRGREKGHSGIFTRGVHHPPYPFPVSRPGESHSRPTHRDGAFAGQDLSEILYFFHLSRTIGVFLGERAPLRVRRDAWQ